MGTFSCGGWLGWVPMECSWAGYGVGIADCRARWLATEAAGRGGRTALRGFAGGPPGRTALQKISLGRRWRDVGGWGQLVGIFLEEATTPKVPFLFLRLSR